MTGVGPFERDHAALLRAAICSGMETTLPRSFHGDADIAA